MPTNQPTPADDDSLEYTFAVTYVSRLTLAEVTDHGRLPSDSPDALAAAHHWDSLVIKVGCCEHHVRRYIIDQYHHMGFWVVKLTLASTRTTQ